MFKIDVVYRVNRRRVSGDQWVDAIARDAKGAVLKELRRRVEALRCHEHSATPRLKHQAPSSTNAMLSYEFCCEALKAEVERALHAPKPESNTCDDETVTGGIMTSLAKRQNARNRFLVRLYERCDGDKFQYHSEEEIGKELGLSTDETDKVTQYLHGRALVEFLGGGHVAITQYGIEESERILEPCVNPSPLSFATS